MFVAYIPIIFLFVIIFISNNNHKKAIKEYLKKRASNKKETGKMLEAAKLLIGKDIYCTRIDGDPVYGILKEIVGNAMALEEKGKITYVNLEFVNALKEYPHKPNGKRVAFIS